MIKISFDDCGIGYRTMYEHSLQIAQVGALGNHGAVIEVDEAQYDEAKDILASLGIRLDYHVKEDRFAFIAKLDHLTQKMPVLQNLPLGYRVLIVIGVSILVLTILVFLLIS